MKLVTQMYTEVFDTPHYFNFHLRSGQVLSIESRSFRSAVLQLMRIWEPKIKCIWYSQFKMRVLDYSTEPAVRGAQTQFLYVNSNKKVYKDWSLLVSKDGAFWRFAANAVTSVAAIQNLRKTRYHWSDGEILEVKEVTHYNRTGFYCHGFLAENLVPIC
jgi:hypothetical protein